MLVFIDSTLKATDLTVWRCDHCKAEFEIKFDHPEGEDPNFCPKCGRAKALPPD